MSSSEIFAKPMLDTEDYLQMYKDQLTELYDKGLLPDLNLEQEYTVYSIRESRFGGHKSIVLTTDDEYFFTVELGFREVNGKKHIYPVTHAIDKSLKAKMKYLGKKVATGYRLIGIAIAVMQEFGSYFKLCKNCQDFCNMYLEAIQLKEAQTLTDGNIAEVLVHLGTILVFLVKATR